MILPPKGNNTNLVITKAGKNSLHLNWLKGASRNFDLRVYAYDEAALGTSSEGVDYYYLPSPKVKGWGTLFADDPDILSRYEMIALLDDDLDMGASLINQCFDMGKTYDLKLWQPSLSWNSHATFAGFLSNPSFELRHINYIELMCPFFQSGYLKRCLPLFDLGFEVGIDLIWCGLSDPDTRHFAVIDKLVVHHTRSVGTLKASNGFQDGRLYEDDIQACLAFFDMPWPRLVSDKAILRDGRKLHSQMAVLWRTFQILPAFLFAPSGFKRSRVRLLLTHLLHMMIRKPAFAKAENVLARLKKEG